VVRAGLLGLPLALAIIGGRPEQFGGLVDLYTRAAAHAGHDRSRLAVSVNSHGFIADERATALDTAFRPFKQTMDTIGRERGWPPLSRAQYDESATLRGANFIGDPDDIIEKILHQHTIFNHQRLLLMLTVGTMPHRDVLRAIELLGTRVAPVVREEIARRTRA
jgi:alkanesulfonate monooxygenase SsuD/methylene tetrahydromethanopterin reductase-like flavin-dependent oxidoreductase (luciferase family)